MRLFFVGIGGIGTSALAQLCAARGDRVSGSNLGKTAIWPQLENAGISVFDEHKAEQLTDDTDILIYSEAIPENNPEREKAKALGIQSMSYFEYLGEVAKDYRVIAVTGTHGKTTTSAMIAAGFLQAKFPATMIVGSKLKEFKGSNFFSTISPDSIESGLRPWLVVEACEYRNNFQFLNPEITIITNLELDHVDYYRDEAHYLETFVNFCSKARTVIYHRGDSLVEKVLENYEGDRVAIDASDFKLSMALTGQHNRQNASLAIAGAEEIADINVKKFKKGISLYEGAWRRMEHLGTVNGLEVYDDYGHHPTEITATLQAFQEKHPDAKIGLIFEPHQYSRTKEFFTEFLESFTSANLIGLYPIYAARDTAEDKAAISRQHFIDQNPKIDRIDNLEMAQAFSAQLNTGDLLVFMGAGNISELAHQFAEHGN